MRTLLIVGDVAMPRPLRELIERGSTSVVEYRAAEVAADTVNPASPLDVDRIVFWSGAGDRDVARVAERYAGIEAAARRELLVFVASQGYAPGPPGPDLGVPSNEVYLWPRDEDRLKMAFLTGA